MAAKLENLLRSSFKPFETNKFVVLVRSSYNGSVCWSRSHPKAVLANTLYTSPVVPRTWLRAYHVGQARGIKASELSNDKPLQKEDVGCPICSASISFSYKDVLFLAQFLSPEGNLLNKRITGVCGKQQKKLEKQIKISRRLGLLPKCGPVTACGN